MAALQADVDPAARRANLLVSGLDLEQTRDRTLRIGGCLVVIGGETRPCERMEAAHRGLQAVMAERWGGGAWGRVDRRRHDPGRRRRGVDRHLVLVRLYPFVA